MQANADCPPLGQFAPAYSFVWWLNWTHVRVSPEKSQGSEMCNSGHDLTGSPGVVMFMVPLRSKSAGPMAGRDHGGGVFR
jgi:hypothetical protein